jgi:hypothetical protein
MVLSSPPAYSSTFAAGASSPRELVSSPQDVDMDNLSESRISSSQEKNDLKVGGTGWSRLERYKFVGKVDMSQGSSPLY